MLAERCQADEELEQLDISLGMAPDPEEEALTALRAHQREAGIVFEDPDAPVSPSPGADGGFPWP